MEAADFSWQETQTMDWSCPRCQRNCPCKRCKNKTSSPVSLKPIGEKRERIFENSSSNSPGLRDSSESVYFSDNEILPAIKRQKVFADPDQPGELPSQPNNFLELAAKNQLCLNYIVRTEKLLKMIRKEQQNISYRLEELTGQPDYQASNSFLPLEEENIGLEPSQKILQSEN
jgi:hypothetical protein